MNQDFDTRSRRTMTGDDREFSAKFNYDVDVLSNKMSQYDFHGRKLVKGRSYTLKDFELKAKLGSGAFGSVFLVKLHETD